MRDLADVSVKMMREQAKAQVKSQAEDAPKTAFSMRCCQSVSCTGSWARPDRPTTAIPTRARNCASSCAKARSTSSEIEIETSVNIGVDIVAPPGMEEMTQQLRGMFSSMGGQKNAETQTRDFRCTSVADRRRGRESDQRRRDQGTRDHRVRAERHRVHRRNRQSRATRRLARRGCESRRRAARSVAAGRRLVGVDKVRHRARPITSCSSRPARSRWPSRPI